MNLSIANINMTGTPNNKLNKIRKEIMKRDNKEVAQDGVQSTAFLLQVARLSGKVDEVARAYYGQVKKTIHSTSIGVKTVVSNSPNKETHERIELIETNESNKFSNIGENKSEEERALKGQEGRETNTASWNSNDKPKSGEYVLSRPPKKPGGEDVDEADTTETISCGTASTSVNSNQTITKGPEHWKMPNIV